MLHTKRECLDSRGVTAFLPSSVVGIVCKGISGMDYRKVGESGGTEFVLFLNKLALKCICVLSTAMYLNYEIYNMPRILFAFFICAQLSLWVSIVHLYTELCSESAHRSI